MRSELPMDLASKPSRRVSLWQWLLLLAAWDGLLPAALWTTPWLLQLLLPGRRGPVEIAAVVLPIIAFFARILIGVQRIRTNHCSVSLRQAQQYFLVFGVFLLVFLDAFLVLLGIMPPNLNWMDVALCGGVYATYLICMAIAMYPGRVPASGFHDAPDGETPAY